MLAQSIPDISSVPAEFVKSWWIMLGFAVAIALLAYNTWLTKQNKGREISGSIETKPAMQHADQSDLDALTETVNAMRGEITAQFRAAQQAGEARVSAITQNVDAEMGALSIRLGALAEALHEKINKAATDNAGQSEAINNLKGQHNNQQLQIENIRRRIDDLIQGGLKNSTRKLS